MESYLGNPNLKKANTQLDWTEEQVLEYQKCMEDPLYFITSYIKIISLDEGSEERRVGKQFRYRGLTYQCKKKKTINTAVCGR